MWSGRKLTKELEGLMNERSYVSLLVAPSTVVSRSRSIRANSVYGTHQAVFRVRVRCKVTQQTLKLLVFRGQEGDTARAKLTKELEGLMNERDVVGAQLVRRNDEISLLYEKIRILEITLHRGKALV